MKKQLFILALLCSYSTNYFAMQYASTDEEKAFLQSARTKNIETFNQLLEAGVNPNVRTRAFGQTALHLLVEGHDNYSPTAAQKAMQMTEKLLAHELIDVDVQDTKGGNTALHYACQKDHQYCSFFGRIQYHHQNDLSNDTSLILVRLLAAKKARADIPNYAQEYPVENTALLLHPNFMLLKDATPMSPKVIQTLIARSLNSVSVNSYDLRSAIFELPPVNPQTIKGALSIIKPKYLNMRQNDQGRHSEHFSLVEVTCHNLLHYVHIVELFTFGIPRVSNAPCFVKLLPMEVTKKIAKKATIG